MVRNPELSGGFERPSSLAETRRNSLARPVGDASRSTRVGKVSKFQESNGRDRWLALEEEAALLGHCDQRLRTFVLAAVDTGFRAGELQALRWKGVDFQRGTVTVASGYTKNGGARTNRMTRRLEQVLRAWKLAAGSNGDGLVFGKYRYREPFERARDAAGLGKDVVFHTLRHTYISRLGMGGADIRTVQELAGHKTIQMTMRYTHLAPAQKRRAVELLDKLLEGEIGSEVTAKVTTVDFAQAGQPAVSG